MCCKYSCSRLQLEKGQSSWDCEVPETSPWVRCWRAACVASGCGRKPDLLATFLFSHWNSWDMSSLNSVEQKPVVIVLMKFSRKLSQSNWPVKVSVRLGADSKHCKVRRLHMGRKHLLTIGCEEMGLTSPPWACGRESWNTTFQAEYLHLSPKLCCVHSDVQDKTCWILGRDKAMREWSSCTAECLCFICYLFITLCLKSSLNC